MINAPRIRFYETTLETAEKNLVGRKRKKPERKDWHFCHFRITSIPEPLAGKPKVVILFVTRYVHDGIILKQIVVEAIPEDCVTDDRWQI